MHIHWAAVLATALLACPLSAGADDARADEGTLVAQAPGSVTELTPDTLAAFVSQGEAVVSICARDVKGLQPCPRAKERMTWLVGSCPRVRMAILDQDKHPHAQYVYPVARDRSLLLFKKNPKSGANEQFDLTTMGEPSRQLITMVLCPMVMFGGSSFAQ